MQRPALGECHASPRVRGHDPGAGRAHPYVHVALSARSACICRQPGWVNTKMLPTRFPGGSKSTKSGVLRQDPRREDNRTHRWMPLRSCSVPRSWRARTRRTLSLRRLQKRIRKRLHRVRAMAGRRVRDERHHRRLRRAWLLPSLRLTPPRPCRPRRQPHRDQARNTRQRAVRSDTGG